MTNRILIPFLAITAALGVGCTTVRPGGSTPNRISTGGAVVTALGGAAGALIGNEVNGARGAAIGAGAGAILTAAAANIVTTNQQNSIDEAKEDGARQERLKIMNDYWDSHATRGGNAPATASTPTTAPATTTVTYPAGVYDGVTYGPREVTVPATR